MKTISFYLIILLFFSNSGILFSQNEKTSDLAMAKWDNTTVDLGSVKQNAAAEAVFTVTNIGKTPLVIKDVRSTCGCTVTSYTREPVMPGKSTEITASYDSKHAGDFNKTITVVLNTEKGTQPLVLKGSVN